MGCDIHSYLEARQPDGTWAAPEGELFPPEDEWDDGSEPFPFRTYGLFGFLAGVRNYYGSPVLAEPRGIPHDASLRVRDKHEWWDTDAHHASWFTLAELLGHNYGQEFTDTNGDRETLRDFLGEWYFARLEQMRKFGEPDRVRVVFWFDN